VAIIHNLYGEGPFGTGLTKELEGQHNAFDHPKVSTRQLAWSLLGDGRSAIHDLLRKR
jgi:hypothetical protein